MPLKQITEDSRLEAISDLLIQYSLGNFDVQLPISDNEDDIDAIIAGVNMLGEELKDVIISRDFLSRIYNSIAEMLIVADLNGNIIDANEVACAKLNANKYALAGQNIFDFISVRGGALALDADRHFENKQDKITIDGGILRKPEVALNCTFSILKDSVGETTGLLLIAEDVTDRLATEKRIIRTIVETQEKERNRFAIDLHDSLGQQLSGIRFYLSALQHGMGQDERLNTQFEKTLKGIDGAIEELRSICFNLMPRTLENHTLKYSLNELAGKYNISNGLKIELDYRKEVPHLLKQFEIACFRIAQEFLNNALKHGKASLVSIQVSISRRDKSLVIQLVDNGKGFVLEEAKKRNGMGLRNIQTRVESYFGSMEFASAPNQGTKLFMKFPLTFVTLPEQSQLP